MLPNCLWAFIPVIFQWGYKTSRRFIYYAFMHIPMLVSDKSKEHHVDGGWLCVLTTPPPSCLIDCYRAQLLVCSFWLVVLLASERTYALIAFFKQLKSTFRLDTRSAATTAPPRLLPNCIAILTFWNFSERIVFEFWVLWRYFEVIQLVLYF